MPLSTHLTIAAAATLTGATNLQAVTSVLSQSFAVDHADGAGAGQAANLWSDTRTLASGASESLDLNGVLFNALGAAFNITKLKGLFIASLSANTTDLTIGNVTNGIVGFFGAATHTVKVQPGGFFAIGTPSAAGYGVTAATADLLQIANAAGAPATYNIIVIGA